MRYFAIALSLVIYHFCAALTAQAQVSIDLSEITPDESQAETQTNVSPSEDAYIAPTDAYVEYYYPNIMNNAPFLPADLRNKTIGCDNLPLASDNYQSAAETLYTKPFWEQRIKSDWTFFNATPEQGKILVVDFAQSPNGQLAYRYLANNTHNDVFEPWSSSKVFAITGAMAKARQAGIGGQILIGDTHIADLVTSIHTYEPIGKADGNSNAIATYFANVAGRGYLTSLFHDEWLLLQHPQVRFKGAYGPRPWQPSSDTWLQLTDETTQAMFAYPSASDDPSYQGYRCTTCERTGNKPMTTLAQAEWLKRLATHDREPSTAHPFLQTEDIDILFNGTGAATSPAGMLSGISRMLHYALAEALVGRPVNNPKAILDQATNGQWRIWQKIGWGPSETRGTGENVMLAHVCLPFTSGSREFTVSAQTSHPEALDISVNHAGIKMQRLLTQSLSQLLQPPNTIGD